jgi:hypothetical protein
VALPIATPVSVSQPAVYLRVQVGAGAVCRFSYSLDSSQFTGTGDAFHGQAPAARSAPKWASSPSSPGPAAEAGYTDFDWFRGE